MLTVKTSAEAEQIIKERFGNIKMPTERVEILSSVGRVLSEDIVSKENVPDFNRSTVDGYAVLAASTFGCSESIPAILDYLGEVQMGEKNNKVIHSGECVYVPTGGELPEGADAMVMLEYAEDYGDGTIGMCKPSAPGQSITFRGDDVKVGDVLLRAGTKLEARQLGILAALGYSEISVYKKPHVAVISTGDELVDVTEKPEGAEVRDINTYTICAALSSLGCTYEKIGIVKDDLPLLESKIRAAVDSADMVIVSGGSSVGIKDSTFKIYDKLGEVLFHGIAIKPGKPTILADIDGKPCFGLPGHPLAAYYIFHLFVSPLINLMTGASKKDMCDIKTASLSLSIPCNHGREECIGVKLDTIDGKTVAEPVYAKSGLISNLSVSDGFIRIPRDCEGLSQDEIIEVELF